jgi:hypothetical protein
MIRLLLGLCVLLVSVPASAAVCFDNGLGSMLVLEVTGTSAPYYTLVGSKGDVLLSGVGRDQAGGRIWISLEAAPVMTPLTWSAQPDTDREDLEIWQGDYHPTSRVLYLMRLGRLGTRLLEWWIEGPCPE